MDLSLYDENQYKLALDNLSVHVNNKDIFMLDNKNTGIGIEVSGDLSKKMYRRSYYKDCIFNSTICKSIGFSGSKFINTIFRDCNLENGNLHSCDFRNVSIEGYRTEQLKMSNVGFHKSTFTYCVFQNLYIFSCGFTDVVFYNTTFKNCTIRLSSVENAQFINCQFINTNLSALNLEYTEFDNIYATDSIFPFTTIPSAFGLLRQLQALGDKNTIYSASRTNHNLSISEYLELIKDFELHYYQKENYYALSNIYISLNRVDEAYETIKTGILNTIQIRDYRILHHFCRLVYLSDIFTIQQRRNLYENITKWIAHENLSISEYHNYQVFMGSLRELLLNNDYDNLTLYFYIKTNINPEDIEKQVILLSTIDNVLAYCNVASSSIELRHNSAYVDFLTVVCKNFTQFSQVLIMIYSSLAGIGLFATGIKKIIDATQNTILNHDQHVTNKLEQEKLKIEISNIKQLQEHQTKMQELEYEKSVAELKKLKNELDNIQAEAKSHNKILLDNNIKVSINHNSKNLHYAPMAEMMQYN